MDLNKPINFSTISIDPNSDKLYYLWDWGDGNNSEWIGPYSYEDRCIINYTWSKGGNYTIKVKSKDYFNSESNWSDSLEISIPKTKSIDNIPKILFWLFERFSILKFYFI